MTMIREQLKLTPHQRMLEFDRMMVNLFELRASKRRMQQAKR